MSKSPFPSTWQGWLLAIALGVLFYPGYYLWVYPWVEHHLVFGQYAVAPYKLVQKDPAASVEKSNNPPTLNITILYSRWVATFASSDLMIIVTQQGKASSADQPVRFRIRAEYPDSSNMKSPIIQWGCREKTNNLQCTPNLRNLTLQIDAASTQVIRVNYVVVPRGGVLKVNEDQFNFKIEPDRGWDFPNKPEESREWPKVMYNPGHVFVDQVIVRGVLVPPWSNVTLLTFILLLEAALEDLRRGFSQRTQHFQWAKQMASRLPPWVVGPAPWLFPWLFPFLSLLFLALWVERWGKVLWGLFALLAILFAFYSLPEKGEGKNAHQAGATQT